MRGHLIPLFTLLLISGAAGVAQQTPPESTGRSPAVAFRAETNVVEFSAVVTDERGNFVRNLTQNDFEIEEDGKAQRPSVFALVDLPTTRPLTALTADGVREPIEFDVRASARDFDGRLYVLLLDDLQTSAQRSPFVRSGARRFVEQHLSVGDLAAVVCTSGRDECQQELTSSRRLLLGAIDRFLGRKLPSAGAERLAVHLRTQSLSDVDVEVARQTTDPQEAERAQNARFMLRAVEQVATRLHDVRGRRKGIVLFSEGLDYDVYQPFTAGASSSPVIVQDARNAVAAAQRANVAVYAIDPRGLEQLPGDAIAVRAPATGMPQLDFGTMRGFGNELLLTQESLIALAEQTGGLAVLNGNDVAAGLARIAADNSTYYLLGYVTDPARAPGRFRNITITVTRPGLQVRARRGYVPQDPKAAARAREVDAKAGTSPTLRAALTNPLPMGSLPTRVFAAAFKGSGRNASVLVATEIDGAALTFDRANGLFNTTLEVSIVAIDHRGEVRGGDRQNLALKLQPEMFERVSRSGVRFLSRINLPPARYQIRVGTSAGAGAALGTVPYDIEVPDYSRAAFVLSGLVLTSSHANAIITTAPDPRMQEVLGPLSPMATRAFRREEMLTTFVELYMAEGTAPSGIECVTSVRRAADGRSVFSSREMRAPEGTRGAVAHGFTAEVPLRDLSPGTYVLRVEARSGVAGQSTYREIPFSVV